MPRGVPNAGYRKTTQYLNRLAQGGAFPRVPGVTSYMPVAQQTKEVNLPTVLETDDEIAARINERFEIIGEMTQAACDGNNRAMIVSGPAGLGKSFTVEQILSQWDPNGHLHHICKGYVRPTGLYRMLYENRNEGDVLVFDDADSIFYDDVSLNFLKAVCDSSEKREVSYKADYDLGVDENTGEAIPHRFQFDGAVIFITNLDFDALIARGHKLAPHLEALVSRAYYIDTTMKTERDCLIRIKEVIKAGMLNFLAKTEAIEVEDFLCNNVGILRELSLRTVLKIAKIRKQGSPRWAALAKITTCKNM